ncbi:MAG TPA: DUF2283 domain-containing protein [Leptospiraceae bacterium]|jgi:uncharacterized protein YuzE|nr:DUF2283 domain-containing protein [Leptospiraceae bacterium]HMY33891.1 DUF2283 domain-containing protein [Leptospiraceae bacterium]HNC57123.1 DUF2283 domain-containing protein [Leptospiraceae bacterium]HNF56064.1 DUF2283 domain-containing protein [Leptospiraceae bacterium]HNH57552.1 DUF2283 domain-containing protein [Leptospiraceae bacterium]
MKLKIDEKADALYFRLDESEIVESEEVSSGVVLDFNKEGKIVGIEIIGLSKRTNKINLRSLQFDFIESAA